MASLAAILSALSASLPILKMLLELMIKTPEEKLGEVAEAVSRAISEVQDGVSHMKENPGDTSKLEDAINRARRRAK